MEERRILVLETGGTIQGNVADQSNKKETLSLRENFKATKTAIENKWRVSPVITPQKVVNKDSSDILPEDWKSISQGVYDNYDDFDAFIVTHGTNTMGYTASALTFALNRLGKPVIVTGSQVPFGLPGSGYPLKAEQPGLQ